MLIDAEEASKRHIDKPPVSIFVKSDGMFSVAGKAVDEAELPNDVKGHVVFLHADRNIKYADFMQAITQLKKASRVKIFLVTEGAKASR
jgi:biopolymer transport protein ExbD